jgi:citrate lyase subunit beta/citryl-CoA lyase
VPGSNPRFLAKAQGLPADQVFLDLEDACAPLAKESARHLIVDALNGGDWTGKTVSCGSTTGPRTGPTGRDHGGRGRWS